MFINTVQYSKYFQVNVQVFNRSHNLQARLGDVWLSRNVWAGKLGWDLHCPGQIALGRLLHSLQSRALGCRYALAETLVHSQPDEAHQWGSLVLVMTPKWTAPGGGFCGSAVLPPQLRMTVGQEGVCSGIGSIFSPQVASYGWHAPLSRGRGS